MRTTLSIDEDVAKLVEHEVRRSGDSFKGTVNRLLRLGLTAARQCNGAKRFVVTPRKMGLRPGQSYDNVAELLEALEGPDHTWS